MHTVSEQGENNRSSTDPEPASHHTREYEYRRGECYVPRSYVDTLPRGLAVEHRKEALQGLETSSIYEFYAGNYKVECSAPHPSHIVPQVQHAGVDMIHRKRPGEEQSGSKYIRDVPLLAEDNVLDEWDRATLNRRTKSGLPFRTQLGLNIQTEIRHPAVEMKDRLVPDISPEEGQKVEPKSVVFPPLAEAIKRAKSTAGKMFESGTRQELDNYGAKWTLLDDNSLQNTFLLHMATWIPPEEVSGPTANEVGSEKLLQENSTEPPHPICSWKANITECTRDKSGGQAQPPRRQTSNKSKGSRSGKSNQSNRINKHPSGGKKGNDDGEEPVPPSDPNSSEVEAEIESLGKLLACPFHKCQPGVFCQNQTTGTEYRACGGPGFKTIARLKEHLYRKHKERPTCDRCQASFTTIAERTLHHRDQVRCPVLPARPSGITEDIEKTLRKKLVGSTDVEKWNEIYKVLFPHESYLPSPYYDEQSIDSLKEFFGRKLPAIVDANLDSMLNTINVSTSSREDLKRQFRETAISSYNECLRLYDRTELPAHQSGLQRSSTADPGLASPFRLVPQRAHLQNSTNGYFDMGYQQNAEGLHRSSIDNSASPMSFPPPTPNFPDTHHPSFSVDDNTQFQTPIRPLTIVERSDSAIGGSVQSSDLDKGQSLAFTPLESSAFFRHGQHLAPTQIMSSNNSQYPTQVSVPQMPLAQNPYSNNQEHMAHMFKYMAGIPLAQNPYGNNPGPNTGQHHPAYSMPPGYNTTPDMPHFQGDGSHQGPYN